MQAWYAQKICTLFSSGLLCPPRGFMNRPSLVWGGAKLYPLVLREADKGGKRATKWTASVRESVFTSIGEDQPPPPGKKARVEVNISCHNNTHTVCTGTVTVTSKC